MFLYRGLELFQFVGSGEGLSGGFLLLSAVESEFLSVLCGFALELGYLGG